MKKSNILAPLIIASSLPAFAGSQGDYLAPVVPASAPESAGGFEDMRRPITNATLFDLALPQTQIRPIFMHHRFPDQLNLAGGGEIDFGGDLNLFALQFEYAFSDRLSFVAMKDGFIDFNPGNTAAFSEQEGFANVGGGLKYAFILDPANSFVASASALFEFPIGSEDVFQGEGDGNVILTVQAAKLWDRLQFAGGAGIQIPVDDAFATQSFVSAHLSYEVNRYFIPLVELNWFSVIDEGDGGNRFSDQAGGAVPSVAPGEGADLINWGAGNSTDYVSLGLGFRSRLTDDISLGFAYEIPLSDEQDNITEDRFTFDATWTF